jgi:hypothetical protein
MTHEPNEHEQQGSVKIAIAVAGALVVAAVTNGVALWSDVRLLSAAVARMESDLTELDATLARISIETSANTVHRAEHERQSERWIEQIERNRDAIEALKEKPSARPDPFTGTEGRQLRERIERLEERNTP